jgi:hypothetical protein
MKVRIINFTMVANFTNMWKIFLAFADCDIEEFLTSTNYDFEEYLGFFDKDFEKIIDTSHGTMSFTPQFFIQDDCSSLASPGSNFQIG